jgi:hypothetical protein
MGESVATVLVFAALAFFVTFSGRVLHSTRPDLSRVWFSLSTAPLPCFPQKGVRGSCREVRAKPSRLVCTNRKGLRTRTRARYSRGPLQRKTPRHLTRRCHSCLLPNCQRSLSKSSANTLRLSLPSYHRPGHILPDPLAVPVGEQDCGLGAHRVELQSGFPVPKWIPSGEPRILSDS